MNYIHTKLRLNTTMSRQGRQLENQNTGACSQKTETLKLDWREMGAANGRPLMVLGCNWFLRDRAQTVWYLQLV